MKALKNYIILFLPGIREVGLPQGFINLCALDESLLMGSLSLPHEILVQRARKIFLPINFSILKEKI